MQIGDEVEVDGKRRWVDGCWKEVERLRSLLSSTSRAPSTSVEACM
jgi:hypothetical protein